MLMQHIKAGLDDPPTTGFSSDNLQLMSDNLTTYWLKLEDSSLIAMIIDPRYKLDIISNKTKKKNARENFDKIFKKYEERPSAQFQESPNTEPTSSTASKAKSSTPSQTLKNKIKEKIVPLAQRFFTESSTIVSPKNELTVYLSEPRVKNFEEDILKWWKTNQIRFPVLSRIARDYLAAQATSVPSERGFSKSGLTVTDLRNSLNPETLRCLMCLHSWFKLNLE
jgi:hypothetical protein